MVSVSGLSCPVRCSPRRPVAACPGDCRGDRSAEGLSRRGSIRGPGRAPVRVSGRGAGVLEARPGPVVPARVRARLGGACPSAGPARASGPGTARECRPRSGPGPGPGRMRPARGPTGPERLGQLGSGAVAPQVGRCGPDLFRLAQCRWPPGGPRGTGVIVDEGLWEDYDRLGRRACCTIHARTRPENMGCWMTRVSQRQVLTFHQDTPVPAEQPKESTPPPKKNQGFE